MELKYCKQSNLRMFRLLGLEKICSEHEQFWANLKESNAPTRLLHNNVSCCSLTEREMFSDLLRQKLCTVAASNILAFCKHSSALWGEGMTLPGGGNQHSKSIVLFLFSVHHEDSVYEYLSHSGFCLNSDLEIGCSFIPPPWTRTDSFLAFILC